jgi:radical SAM superfamily enzyme YgiQ (UPF0313 family)
MKVKFIEATRYLDNGRLLKTRKLFYPALTFPLLAALTPPDIEISMTHEIFEGTDIDFDEKADLVGLTSITNNVYRAYEIADEFRRRGVPVVMGGFHASVEPEEALRHADAVIIGEAEETWPEFLRDFRDGKSRPVYRTSNRPSLAGLPVPRFDILNTKHYRGYRRKGLARKLLPPVIPIQTARGCPYSCDFCDITHFHAGTYRPRPIRDVVEEIRAQRARHVCFVDDNIFADHERAKELFRSLVPLKIRWVGQGTLTAAQDGELLRLARRSGCFGILAGIETISPESLASVGKAGLNRVDSYRRLLRAFRKKGIDVNASMTFGFDGDGADVFNATYDFLMANRVPYAGLQPIRPSPGTPLYGRLMREGRLKDERWWLNRELTARVFELKFTGSAIPEIDFKKGLFRMYNRFYSWPSILRRFLVPPQRGFPLKILVTAALRRKISARAFISEV